MKKIKNMKGTQTDYLNHPNGMCSLLKTNLNSKSYGRAVHFKTAFLHLRRWYENIKLRNKKQRTRID